MAEKTCPKDKEYDAYQDKCVKQETVSKETFKSTMLGVFVGFIALFGLIMYFYFAPSSVERGFEDIIGSGLLFAIFLVLSGFVLVGVGVFSFVSIKARKLTTFIVLLAICIIIAVIGFLLLPLPIPFARTIATILFALAGIGIIVAIIIAILPRPRSLTSIAVIVIGAVTILLGLLILLFI